MAVMPYRKTSLKAGSSTSSDLATLLAGPLCPLAKNVPALPKGLKKEQKVKEETMRTALVKSIDILWKVPAIRSDCWAWLDKQAQAQIRKEGGVGVDALWPNTCKSVGKALSILTHTRIRE